MKKTFYFINFLFIYLTISTFCFAADSVYFNKGKNLFGKNEFDKSKFFFEKDIVFNPRSEKSYLYLAKIFNKDDNDLEQEINLQNVLLLNPKNDEAIYMFALLKIKQSDYDKAKELIERFDLVCVSFCGKKKEVKEKFNKLTPENGKDKN